MTADRLPASVSFLPPLLAATVLLSLLPGLLTLQSLAQGFPTLSIALAALALLLDGRLPRALGLALAASVVLAGALGLAQALGLPLDKADREGAAIGQGMVLPTAGALLGLGAALLIRAQLGARARTPLRVLLALPLALPVFALLALGFAAPEKAIWQRVSEPALTQALALGALALGLLAGRRGASAKRRLHLPDGWVELCVVGLLVASMLLWRALLVDTEQAALDLQRAELSQLGGRLQSSLAAFVRPISRMAERWDVQGGTPEALWRINARSLLRDIPGLVSLQRLDATGTVLWAEPLPASAGLVGSRPNQDPRRIALLESARRSGQPVFSEPIELLQGGLGLLLFAPLQGGEDGMLVAVLRLAPRFENVVELSTANRALAIGHGEQIAYAGPEFPPVGADPQGLLRQPAGGRLSAWWVATPVAQPTSALLRLPALTLALATVGALLLHLAMLGWRDGLRRERALAESGEALSEAHRRLAMATRVARLGVWEWSRSRGELIWDEQTREIFGATADPRPPLQILADCIDPEARSRLNQALRAAAQADGVIELDLSAHRLDGQPIELHLTARLVRHPMRRLERLLGVLADVTERQRLERMKSAFVSTVSHELRTPLTAISGSLAMLEAGSLGELPAAAGQLLQVSRQNTARLALLIDDLLDFERLAQGGLRVQPRDLDLCAELSRALRLNDSYVQRFGVRLAEPHGPPGLRVRADPDRLQQVLANLLSNAAKFSRPGGQVELGALNEGDHVRIEVCDRGDGVPEDFRPRLFSRFSQADGSDSRRHSGTGLGLAICRELVAAMGGTIGYVPRAGGGSVFWFTLPAAATLS